MSQLTDDLQQNYRAFVEGIKATGKIWGLSSPEGWVVCDSEEYEETDVIPFWSDEAEAKAHCNEEWADKETVAIELEAFVAEWLKDMDEDGILIGTNWNSELAGLEIEPLELAKELLDEDA